MKEYIKHLLKSSQCFLSMLTIVLINIIFPHYASILISIPFIIVTIGLTLSELVFFVIEGFQDVTKKL